MRRTSLYFACVFVVEIIVFSFLLVWVFDVTAENQLDRVKTLASILAPFGSILLTSALVYHNYWQRPELKMLGVLIEPLDANGQNVAKNKYKKTGYRKDFNIAKKQAFDQIMPVVQSGYMKIECQSRPSKIRILADIGNIGINETAIHEYSVELLAPEKKIVAIYSVKEILKHQMKVTLDFEYPEANLLVDESLTLRITAKASTEKKSKKINVIISDGCKTIKWRQLNR